MNNMRTNEITSWLNTRFLHSKLILEPLTGDASLRRYYRMSFNRVPYVIMDAPPEHEPLEPFIDSTARLLQAGLNVPQIYHQHLQLGCLVLDDFGDKTYLSQLNNETCDLLYQKAINALITLQQKVSVQNLPVFHRRFIENELTLFKHWFLEVHSKQKQVCLNDTFEYLISNCLKQNMVPIHRDYHSRNLMLLVNREVGILDHQDMMLGPASYDLVSLIKDCYIDWPQQKVNEWLDYYIDNSHLDLSMNFKHQFSLTGVQRHLKAIGIFARLAHHYDKPNYLEYIPRSLKYVQEIADNDPNLRELALIIKKVS
jgi:aminoglycoside/choline kinase family phosphotransferase